MNKRNLYYSTNLLAPEVTFREALLKGLAPDGGLYLPLIIPKLSQDDLLSFSGKTYPEIAFKVLDKIIGEDVEENTLLKICRDAYNFDVPIENVYCRNYVMRLDQGPTASFKDFAARMMARLMEYFLDLDNQHLTILTATSGDTGSAVANAFYGLKNIRVIILFPADEVTEMQRKQMTTMKRNIQVISVDGKFDDCQQLVKNAFMDPNLSHIPLSSANSINIGRLLPQSIYYFWAWSRLSAKINVPVVFSVPSGNFGNLMGGLIAREMGLPVKCFIISTNENDEVPVYLKTGKYEPVNPSRNCISSAMNVGHPSNLARIIALYGGMMNEAGCIIKEPDIDKMRNDFFTVSVTDDEARETIEWCYKRFNLLLEPHGAIAWQGLQKYLLKNPKKSAEKRLCVSLETAHPAKFPEEIMNILKFIPPIPESLSKIEVEDEEFISLENNYHNLKELILKHYKLRKRL